MTLKRRIAALLGALALTALAVSPVFATDIKSTQVPTAASNPDVLGGDDECGTFDQEGMALWHFILNGAPTGQTITLTASFDTDGDLIADETKTDVGDEADSSGTYHFEVITPDDWVLVGASTDVDGAQLVLSHTCVGSPPPEVPEAPLAIMLPLIALAAFGGYLLFQRRKASVAV